MGDTETGTGTDETAAAEETGRDERIDRLEDRQEQQGHILTRIEEAISRLGGGVEPTHATAQAQTERRLDRPSSIQAEVKAELERARRDQEAEAAAEAEKAERQQLRDDVAALREVPPAPPVRRATLLLGWGDGRK
jgi:hypothetical protein